MVAKARKWKHRLGELVDRVHQLKYEFDAPFSTITSRTTIALRCTICGWRWDTTVANVINDHRLCPNCTGYVRWTNKKQLIYDRVSKLDCVLTKPLPYKCNKGTKLHLSCNKCGCVWTTTIDSFMSHGTGCRCCVRRYRCDGILFDSRPEILTYLYFKKRGWWIERNPVHSGDHFSYTDEIGRNHEFFPDFRIENGYLEVKAMDGMDARARYKYHACCDNGFPVVFWSESGYCDTQSYKFLYGQEFSDLHEIADRCRIPSAT